MDIIGADGSDGGLLPAMHIDQSLEGVLLAGAEQPVNRAFLINFAVVGIETVEQVVPDGFPWGCTLCAEGIGDELEVLLQRVFALDDFHKLHDFSGEVAL